MKVKAILLSLVVLSGASGLVQAQEKDLTGTLDFTYLSSYIWRGFDYYANDHSAMQSNINLDLYGTGFGVGVGWTSAIHSGFENSERINLALYYTNTAYEDEAYATKYWTGWKYYGFPDEPRSGSKTAASAQAADMQEFFLELFWPNVCPFGVVPNYTLIAMWPSEGDSAARKNSGWAHIAGMGYDLTVPGILPDTAEQVLHLSAAMVYNDGMAPGVVINTAGGTVDHDWSHAVFGISTDFDCGNNLSFTPGIYYQSSWDDSVNTEDETWASLSLKYAF